MTKEHYYYVYIATNKHNKVLYTGVTNKLLRRGVQHKDKIFKSSFTAKYNINKIVYYEVFGNVYNAIAREKQIKGWIRKRKVELIKGMNPEWKDFMIDMLPLPCQDPALSDKPRDPSLRSG